jgi:hypothetical protein
MLDGEPSLTRDRVVSLVSYMFDVVAREMTAGAQHTAAGVDRES